MDLTYFGPVVHDTEDSVDPVFHLIKRNYSSSLTQHHDPESSRTIVQRTSTAYPQENRAHVARKP